MISKAAQLLLALKEREQVLLKDFKGPKHGPTIGDMYEGLTLKIIDQAIPQGLDIQIVTGFIEDRFGKFSPQMDVMLVTGSGRSIPNTNKYIWPVQDVLAVIEVKKTLYGADLQDAFDKMSAVSQLAIDWVENSMAKKVSCGASYQAFANLTGHYPQDTAAIDAMSDEYSQMLSCLVKEQFAPVRVIFAYEGYVNEASLRSGLADFLTSRMMTYGTGPISIPNLIVCRNNSLLKCNGQPYIGRLRNDKWDLIVSNSQNPLRLLLELLLTKITNRFNLAPIVDDKEEDERMAPFLSARLKQIEDKMGWEYWVTNFDFDKAVQNEPLEWEPYAASRAEWVIMMRAMSEGKLHEKEPDLCSYLEKNNLNPKATIQKMVDARLLAWAGDEYIRPISNDFISCTGPDGQFYISDSPERLAKWFAENLKSKSK